MKEFINKVRYKARYAFTDTVEEFKLFRDINKSSSSHCAISFTARRDIPATTIIKVSSSPNFLFAAHQDFEPWVFRDILQSIQLNQKITSLEISSSELLDKFSKYYIQFFKHLPKIKSLTVNLPKKFSEKNLLALMAQLASNKSFEDLSINGENLHRDFAGNIPIKEIISKNRSLKSLKLSNITLSDQEVSELIEVMPRSSLTSLSLEGCNITPSALVKITQALPQTKISQLYIDNPLNNNELQYIYNLIRILPESNLVTFYLKNITKPLPNGDSQQVPKISEHIPVQIDNNGSNMIWSSKKDLLWQWNVQSTASLSNFLDHYIQSLINNHRLIDEQQFNQAVNTSLNELSYELDIFTKTINIDDKLKDLSPEEAFKYKFKLFLDKLFINSTLFNKLPV